MIVNGKWVDYDLDLALINNTADPANSIQLLILFTLLSLFYFVLTKIVHYNKTNVSLARKFVSSMKS